MRKGLEFAAVSGVVLALATGGSASALVPSTGSAAKNCSNQTVSGGKGHPEQTLRLVVTGKVSCAGAHHVVGAYFGKMAAGGCRVQNNRCALTVASGWGCSIISPVAERKELGGAFVGCVRSNARILVYQTKKHLAPAPVPSKPTAFEVRLPAGFFLCDITVSPIVGGGGLAGAGGAFCLSHGSRPAEVNWHAANVQSNGDVTSCSEEVSMMRADCYAGQGNDEGLPYLSPRQQTTVGSLTCKVLEAGVECTVTATGKGFLITPESSTEVGG